MTDLRGYSKAFLCELFLLYRSFPCLWRVQSKEYEDRSAKDKAWDMITAKFCEVDPEIDKRSAIKKMNSLRASWRREKKKVRESLRSGAGADDVYVPRLWYFELLSFIEAEESCSYTDELEVLLVEDGGTHDSRDANTPLSTSSTPTTSRSATADTSRLPSNKRALDQSTEVLLVEDGGTHDSRDANTPLSTSSTPTTSRSATADTSRWPSNKRALDQSTEVLNFIKDKFSKEQEKPCRLDILGKNWAEKLKLLPNDQRIFAEKLINDVLFEAELGTLNRHCSVSIQAPAHPTQDTITKQLD